MLPEPVMDAILGAIRDSRGKPNAGEIEDALKQLAIAAAAICRVMPPGVKDRFVMMFDQEMSREVVRKEPE